MISEHLKTPVQCAYCPDFIGAYCTGRYPVKGLGSIWVAKDSNGRHRRMAEALVQQ
jgi:hypothetical protein